MKSLFLQCWKPNGPNRDGIRVLELTYWTELNVAIIPSMSVPTNLCSKTHDMDFRRDQFLF